jgi:cysteine-rich repeat protein
VTGRLAAATLALACLGAGAARAAVLVVAPAGGDFTAIQPALDAAQPGDVVRVREAPAPYFEKLVFPRSGAPGAPIRLEAWPGEQPVVDGTGIAGDDLILIADRSWVEVVGFELRNDLGVNDGSGIRVVGAGSHIELRRNRIHDVRGKNAMGITVFATAPTPIGDLVIDGNEVFDCEPAPSEALTLNGNVDGFTVTNNVVRDVDNIGIDAIGGETDIQPNPALVARNGVFRGNRVARARSSYGGGFAGGIYIDGGRDIVVENNVVTESDLGIEVGAENPGIVARNITVRNNVLYANDKACLVFGGYAASRGRVADSRFTGNTCWRNDTLGAGFGELWIQWADDNLVHGNVFVATAQNLLLLSDAGSANTLLDWNLWFAPGGAAAARFVWNGTEHVGLDAYRLATGQDAHSLFADPLLADPAAGDVHLTDGSPAIDAGDPGFVPDPGEADLDAGPRVLGPRVDIGADEAARCGNGAVEPPEECDDGNADSGDGCDANCTTTRCGNGVVTADEQCDDGGAIGGDCCSATCQREPDGSPCDDGDVCTQADACGLGACAGRPEPAADCREPDTGALSLRGDALADPRRRQLAWKWHSAAPTPVTDLGDPVSGGTGYALCLYDTLGGAASVALRAAAPAQGVCRGRPCWKSLGTKGFRYGDKDATPDGIVALKLQAGAAGRTRLTLKAKGALLGSPALPLAQSPAVTVQLRRAGGACWETVLPAPARRSDGDRFQDKTP